MYEVEMSPLASGLEPTTVAATLSQAGQGKVMRSTRGQVVALSNISYSPYPAPDGAFHIDITVSDDAAPAQATRHRLETQLDRDTLDAVADPILADAMAFTYLANATQWWDQRSTNGSPFGMREIAVLD